LNEAVKQDKVVWITGASSGIGKELALLYAKNGFLVYASARNAQSLQSLSDESQKLSGTIIAAPMDVTHPSDIQSFVDKRVATQTLPTLTILNAGYYEAIGLDELSMENFVSTFGVNFFGVTRAMTALLPHYRKQQSGHLAIVSSVAGYTGLPRAASYGSSKAALIHLCESIKCECDAAGITVSMVNPGFVRTPLTDKNDFPMPFIIEPEDAAQRIKIGLDKKRFDINFPKRFSLLLKFLRLLPYPLYFKLTSRL